MTEEITVTLSLREARALANCGAMWVDVLDDIPTPVKGDESVRPLEGAVMKIDVALLCEEGVEL